MMGYCAVKLKKAGVKIYFATAVKFANLIHIKYFLIALNQNHRGKGNPLCYQYVRPTFLAYIGTAVVFQALNHVSRSW